MELKEHQFVVTCADIQSILVLWFGFQDKMSVGPIFCQIHFSQKCNLHSSATFTWSLLLHRAFLAAATYSPKITVQAKMENGNQFQYDETFWTHLAHFCERIELLCSWVSHFFSALGKTVAVYRRSTKKHFSCAAVQKIRALWDWFLYFYNLRLISDHLNGSRDGLSRFPEARIEKHLVSFDQLLKKKRKYTIWNTKNVNTNTKQSLSSTILQKLRLFIRNFAPAFIFL